MSGARATQLLDGYVAIGVLREKVRNDKTCYVYRRSTASSTVSGPVTKPDTLSPSGEDPESVRKTDRTGHENTEVARDFSNVFEAQQEDSLIPAKSLSGVRSSSLCTEKPDTGQPNEGYTRAREDVGGYVVEPLPAWVTEPTDPDVSDPIGTHDLEDEHATRF